MLPGLPRYYHVSGPCCLSADTFFAIICIIIINNYRTAGGVWQVADTENCEKLRSQQTQVLYTNSICGLSCHTRYDILSYLQLDTRLFFLFFIAAFGYFWYAKNMLYKPRGLERLYEIDWAQDWQTYCVAQTPLPQLSTWHSLTCVSHLLVSISSFSS